MSNTWTYHSLPDLSARPAWSRPSCRQTASESRTGGLDGSATWPYDAAESASDGVQRQTLSESVWRCCRELAVLDLSSSNTKLRLEVGQLYALVLLTYSGSQCYQTEPMSEAGGHR